MRHFDSILTHQMYRSFIVLAVVIVAASSGCHRGFYRRQADAEGMRLIEQKANSPYWDLQDYSLRPRHDSRMHQPFSQDHPPMPPDDPYSHRLMHCVDDKEGYPLWHANGDTWYVENPEWRLYLPLNEYGELEIDLNSALQTALVHSREYQREQEELYLSALDVSLQRFTFDSQLFFGYGADFISDGPARNGTGTASNTLESATGARGLRLEKLGITGSTLVVGFANSLLWQYSGSNTHTAATLVDFSIIQPLLSRAGRDRVLEELTDAERTLLGNVRQLERYRRGFMLQITTGRSAGSGVSRGGSFIGGSAGGGVGGVGGLIGLLRDLQNIQIQESNVASLRAFLSQFREFNQVGRVDQLQVQQSESALYQAQDDLLQARNNYQTNLDQFKILMGLPPDLPVQINDPMLDQFQLIDRETIEIQNMITDLQRRAGIVIIRIEDRRTIFLEPSDSDNRITDSTVDGLFWTQQDADDLQELKALIAQARELNRRIQTVTIPRARQDVEDLRNSLDLRLENIRRLREQLESVDQGPAGYSVEPEILESERLITGPADRDEEIDILAPAFDAIDEELRAIDEALDRFIEFGDELPPIDLYRLIYSEVLKQIPKQLTELSGRFLELSLVLVRARTDTISRTPIDISSELAFDIARRNRRDWMNARSDLVDSWRQIEFAADDLESSFDLVFEGDLSNTGDNPLRLRGTTGRLRAGFQFDAPFTRLVERNTYRETLIEYDRTRRQYYAFEDEVSRSLREIIRNIEQSKISFELSRRSILVAVAQVELARFNLIRPPRPGTERDSLGATTARDLTDALSRLQSAQLSFLNVWVNYEVLRRTLDFELGTMQLDATGNWVDPGPLTEEGALDVLQRSIYSADEVVPPWEHPALEYIRPMLQDDLNMPLEPLDLGPSNDVLPSFNAPDGLGRLPSVEPTSGGESIRPVLYETDASLPDIRLRPPPNQAEATAPRAGLRIPDFGASQTRGD